MKSRDFCYWAQGFFEISEVSNKNITLNSSQIELMKKHLDMVFSFENVVQENIKKPEYDKLKNLPNYTYDPGVRYYSC